MEEGWQMYWLPLIFRATNVLKDCHEFELAQEPGFCAWRTKLIEHPAFKCTRSTQQVYLDGYELRVPTSEANNQAATQSIGQTQVWWQLQSILV
ncbi:hypothetical protein J3A83DRAFT_3001917 [Scleroderma citrinum]